MTHAVEVAGLISQSLPSERKPRKKMVALSAIALQLGISSSEIEGWCDRSDLEVAEGCRGELEIDAETMDTFVRQYRNYQYKKMAELDIAVLLQAQPVTISAQAAAELKAQLEAQKSVDYEGLPSDLPNNPEEVGEENSDSLPLNSSLTEPQSTQASTQISIQEDEGNEAPEAEKINFTLEGIRRGGSYLDTLKEVVEAQPLENRKLCIKALKGDDSQLRQQIIEAIYRGKATEGGLLREAQKLKG